MPSDSIDVLGTDWTKLKTAIAQLGRKRQARPGTLRLLENWAAIVDDESRKLSSYNPDEQVKLVDKVSRLVLRIKAVVDALSQGTPVRSGAIYEVLDESIREIVGAELTRDIVIAASPFRSESLKSAVEPMDGELSFVLFVSPGSGYDRLPLLPRVAHEAAHSDADIRDKVLNGTMRTKWLGEACCDMVALLLAGPSFLMSTRAFVELIGRDSARRPDARHPSFAMRVAILRVMTDHIWPSGAARVFALGELDAVKDLTCRPEDAADERRLTRQVLESSPRYARLNRDPGVWEDIYAGRAASNTQSKLLRMNVEAVRESQRR